MAKVTACELPEDSLLAAFGGPEDYRDCFCRVVPGEVSLEDYIERFYRSAAFLPERLLLGVLTGNASSDAARAVARGEAERFGAWKLVERRSATSGPQGRPPARSDAAEGRVSEESLRGRMAPPALEAKQATRDEALLESKDTNTASWFAVEPMPSSSAAVGQTRLLFGSWVGNLDQSRWKAMLAPHVWYSKVLLGAV